MTRVPNFAEIAFARPALDGGDFAVSGASWLTPEGLAVKPAYGEADLAGIDAVGIGLLVSVAASVINFVTARTLMTVGRQRNSITLEADAHHLMTDVWTSAGVIGGVALVWMTGWLWLDPAIALLVAANIVWTGWRLMRRSADGLMDGSLPPEKLAEIEAVLAGYRQQGLAFHALRTRQAGSRAFGGAYPGPWRLDRAAGP